MCLSDLGAPLGASESLLSLREHLMPGGSSLVEFLAPEQTDQASLAVASGRVCLLDLYDEAVRRGAVYASELKEIPEEEFVVQGVPRPPPPGIVLRPCSISAGWASPLS